MSAILSPPFLIPKIRCQIHNQRPQKLLSTKFRGNRVVSEITCPTYWISTILRIVWLFQIGETIFRIKFQYSFDSKKNYEKKNFRFLVLFSKFGARLDFLLDQTKFWPWILEVHTQNDKETWFSLENFSFPVMRMRLEHKLKNCSFSSLRGYTSVTLLKNRFFCAFFNSLYVQEYPVKKIKSCKYLFFSRNKFFQICWHCNLKKNYPIDLNFVLSTIEYIYSTMT